MKIRLMEISDYAQVYNLWMNSPGMGFNDLDDSKEGIKKYLLRNPKTCFVAEKENKIIGVILSGHDGRRGFIHHTSVEIHYQKQGIGQNLVNHALVALEEEGIHKVVLLVFKKNELGNSFWEGNGFGSREDVIYRDKCIHELKRIDT